jgi:hypothetical protein
VRVWARWGLASVLVLAPLCAPAATFKVTPLSLEAGVKIAIEGRLTLEDWHRFVGIVEQHPKAILVLGDSSGGQALPAMWMGRLARRAGYSTAVLPNKRCASSCALLWLAGSKRYLFPGAQVGFHAVYRTVGGKFIADPSDNAVVGAYFHEIGIVSEKAIRHLTKASPNEVTWLSLAEAEGFGIEVSAPPEKLGLE